MPENEREAWNQRYREGSHGGSEPDPFLIESERTLLAAAFPQAGSALDVAGGTGRHAVYLAERGWRVTLTDISSVGIAHARARAAGRNVTIQTVEGNTSELDFGHERFDLVLVFFYLERNILPALAAALRPGGLVLYKTYTEEHEKFARRVGRPIYYLRPGELLTAFPGFRVLHYRESMIERGVAELAARKPL